MPALPAAGAIPYCSLDGYIDPTGVVDITRGLRSQREIFSSTCVGVSDWR